MTAQATCRACCSEEPARSLARSLGFSQCKEVAEQGRLAAHGLLGGELIVGVAVAHAPEGLAVGPLGPGGEAFACVPLRVGLVASPPGIRVHVGGVAGVHSGNAIV